MSCGPSEKLKELADKVQAAEDKFDSIINESPLGKLNDLKNEALGAANSVMGGLEGMIPSILNKVLAAADKTLHEDVTDFLKIIMLGALNKDGIETQLTYLKNKWGDIDLGDIKNFDDLQNLLRTGAIDLDSICKLIPNIEKEGVNVTVKATPTSFPDIDPAAILKGGSLPKFPDAKVVIDTSIRKKENLKEFFNLEIPEFDW
jgi:hypothetical protein